MKFSHLKPFFIIIIFCQCILISGNASRYFTNENVKRRTDGSNKPAESKIHFASYYEDHMVLQRAPQRAVIWGYASSQGMTIETSFQNKIYSTVSVQGEFNVPIWRITLDPVSEVGPFDITFRVSTFDSITLHDVLFGDVWLCSGQSNMQFTVDMSFNGKEEIANASNYPHIRLFAVKTIYSDKPLYDLNQDDILLHWALAGKASVGGPSFQYFSAVCWMYGRFLYENLKYPIGLVSSVYGGTIVEAWSSPDSLKKCNITNTKVPPRDEYGVPTPVQNFGPHNNSALWNAMIHPLLNMTIYGTIWYQGESNCYFPQTYGCTFPAMIDDWRTKFFEGTMRQTDPMFPFGFVQIGADQADYSLDGGFPEIRWHQTADFGYAPNDRLRRTFMAIAVDLPDFTSPYSPIHTRDKTDVAKRLLLGGLAIAYDKKVNYQGPFPKTFNFNSTTNTMDIIYDLFGMSKIEVKSEDGFEVCCSYEKPFKCTNGTSWWLPSAVEKYSIQSVTISTVRCTAIGGQLAGVRYLWRKTPCPFKMCAVYAESLPAPPFVSYGPWNSL